ncbi:hypothetical protein PS645_05398 [Pseudomonas fluorescens]|uniref:Uncharacterized protein n=1 Tax=Pseudomonas fluorescens TaxID=294 RepID=A0A5E6T9H5_PSEFL|nr:hypothetical protein PS645_02541 [Pseudomonas fluorescens]VVN40888.1 hypothetical protein PS645_05398 [Pseudomonas fluorescens]
MMGWGIERIVQAQLRRLRLVVQFDRHKRQGRLGARKNSSLDQRRRRLADVSDFRAIGSRFAEQAVGPWLFFVLVVTPARAQAIVPLTDKPGGRPAFPLFESREFFVQIQRIEIKFGRRPLFLADGTGFRCFDVARSNRRAHLFAGLLEQLLRGIEYLQARAATNYSAGHAQLSMVNAEAGLAMRALSDEAVGHAAIRCVQRFILAPTAGDAHPAIAIGDRVQVKVLRISGGHFVALFGEDA